MYQLEKELNCQLSDLTVIELITIAEELEIEQIREEGYWEDFEYRFD